MGAAQQQNGGGTSASDASMQAQDADIELATIAANCRQLKSSSAEDVAAKAKTVCTQLERSNPGGCDGCPWRHKLFTPSSLWQIAQMEAEQNAAPKANGAAHSGDVPSANAPPAQQQTSEQEQLSPEEQAEIQRLAALTPLLYGKQREGAAMQLGIGVTFLDKEVNKARNAGESEAISNTANACARLSGDFPNSFAYDEMSQRTMIYTTEGWVKLSDSHVIEMQMYLQTEGLDYISKDATRDAIDACARRNSYHPIRNYLGGLKWNRRRRLNTWLSRYLGAKDSKYTRAVGRMFLISAVARVEQPGCQADYTLVLEGPQGELKSSVCRVLFGDAYFLDHLPPLNNRDSSQILRGKWGIECAERVAFGKARIEETKAFLTRRTEKYFSRYGHLESEEPRQCVIVISTNESIYLYDTTGNRRYWPVLVGTIDLAALKRDCDQLWAEAKARYDKGEHWWPDREFERKYIRPEQEAREGSDDPWQEVIASWLEKPQTQSVTEGGRPGHQVTGPPPDRVTIAMVAQHALLMQAREMERKDSDRIANILLNGLKWTRGPKVKGQQLWLRPQPPREEAG
jgi:predicted P-loop ATPase